MLHKYLPGDIRDRIQTMIEETETSQNELAEKLGMTDEARAKFEEGLMALFGSLEMYAN